MKQPDSVRQRLTAAWRRNWTDWLGGGGTWPLRVGLEAPTESDARRHWATFQDWVRTYRRPEWDGITQWESRTWRHLGDQDVPVSLSFAGPDAVAAVLGGDTQSEWQQAHARWAERFADWPDLGEELRAIAGWLGELEQAEYERFVLAFNWLAAHPDTGMYVRQLPIAGLDSKWVERHAGPLARLLARRLGRDSGPLPVVAGLTTDAPRFRIRLLDAELRRQLGGLSDIEVRQDELAKLDLPIKVALVIENQQTALACGDLPGAVLIMGGGFKVTGLGRIRWLERVPVVYWGDIDTHGLAILHALRSWHSHTETCLMDEATLLAHRPLWAHEATPFTGELGLLTESERELFRKLLSGHWGNRVRLEQERLAWPAAWQALQAAVRSSSLPISEHSWPD